MNDAELEEFLTKRFERRWKMLIYSIWGWLFIAVILFAFVSSANGGEECISS